MNCSPTGSSVHEISQARILEWITISFSRGTSRPNGRTRIFCIGRQILYWLRYKEKYMRLAPHSSTLAWKIPWTEEPGRLQSMGSYRVGHDWSDLAAAAASLNTIPKAQSMKERTTQLWNRPKTLTDTLSKKIYTRQKSMNICSTSWVTGKCKLK